MRPHFDARGAEAAFNLGASASVKTTTAGVTNAASKSGHESFDARWIEAAHGRWREAARRWGLWSLRGAIGRLLHAGVTIEGGPGEDDEHRVVRGCDSRRVRVLQHVERCSGLSPTRASGAML